MTAVPAVGATVLQITPVASIVRVLQDITPEVADELRATLDEAVSARPRVVVDLAETHTIDSAGLGALVRARNAARHRDGTLVLAAPSRFVQTVLRTMRLHTAFPVYGTVEQAVAGNDQVPTRPA
jgi:anti-sigma B factor antagonist